MSTVESKPEELQAAEAAVDVAAVDEAPVTGNLFRRPAGNLGPPPDHDERSLIADLLREHADRLTTAASGWQKGLRAGIISDLMPENLAETIFCALCLVSAGMSARDRGVWQSWKLVEAADQLAEVVFRASGGSDYGFRWEGRQPADSFVLADRIKSFCEAARQWANPPERDASETRRIETLGELVSQDVSEKQIAVVLGRDPTWVKLAKAGEIPQAEIDAASVKQFPVTPANWPHRKPGIEHLEVCVRALAEYFSVDPLEAF
jgi:hypothetical protein